MADIQDPKREAFQRKCSIIISLIASMLLVNNLGSQNAAGAASFQNAAAINTYAFYQAKNIRQNDLNLAAQTLDGIANTAIPLANESAKQQLRQQAEAMRAKAISYDSEPSSGEGKKELFVKAKALEAERDEIRKSGPWLTFAGSGFQISIVLLSASILAVAPALYVASIAVGALSALLMSQGLWLWLPIVLKWIKRSIAAFLLAMFILALKIAKRIS